MLFLLSCLLIIGLSVDSVYAYESEYIDLEVNNVFIEDALELISQKTGVNIVCNFPKQYRVTAFLKDVHYQKALELLVKLCGISYQRQGHVYLVGKNMPDYCEGFEIGYHKTYRMQFTPAPQIPPLLTALFTQDDKGFKFVVNDPLNMLINTGYNRTMNAVDKLIKVVDVPNLQISIELELSKITSGAKSEILEQITGVVESNSTLHLRSKKHIQDVTITPRVNDDSWMIINISGYIFINGNNRRQLQTQFRCRDKDNIEIFQMFSKKDNVTYSIKITPRIESFNERGLKK